MALIKCIECGRDVSDKAVSCPHCGCPSEYQRGAMSNSDFNNKMSILGKTYDMTEVVELTKRNELLKAVKLIKDMVINLSLKDAKDIVDYIYANGTPPSTMQPTNSPKLTQQPSCKCPTCNSSNVTKIGYIERRASIFAFGVASGKIGKTFKCNDCGYSW